MMEKRIKRNENYIINDKGVVYSIKGNKKTELKQTWNESRGYIVYLGKTGVSVALLMAETFLEQQANQNIVKHINGNRKDNRIENIKWTSEQELFNERIQNALKIIPLSNKYEKRISEISGFEDFVGYTITIDGDVYSYIGGKHKLKYSSNKGYLQVTIGSRLKKRVTRKIHRLVALAFIPNPNNYKQVNHIDGNKQNNNINNLEWIDNKNNQRHAILNGLKQTSVIKMYSLENKLLKTFNSMFEVLNFLDITSSSAIYECINGTYKQAYGYIWESIPKKVQRPSKV